MRAAFGSAMTLRMLIVAAALAAAPGVMLSGGHDFGRAANAYDAPSDFIEIPGAPFTMGASRAGDPDAFDNERWPGATGQGMVDVPTFYISRHEVTVGEFTQFVRATQWKVDGRALAAPPTHPVTHVSWPDALAYARWLSKTLQGTARNRVPGGWRVTLPTEAQWEKAARGTDSRRYPWGNAPRAGVANFRWTDGSNFPRTPEGTTLVVPQGTAPAPVGFFKCPDCAHGLADMSGNVWEWTSSPYQPYPYRTDDDRVNLEADALWVIRGGHFGDDARMVRTTARTGADPGARRPFIGFRVVISPGLTP